MVKRSRQSKYNVINAAVAINLATALLKKEVVNLDDNIILLILYHAQYLLLLTAIILLRQNRPDLNVNGLSAAKIDLYQGSKYKIIICDLIVDLKIRFINIINRLNVGLSRSRYGLYIIGNVGQIEKNSIRKI